jgi:Arc/MetJ family transcription regulator
MLSIVPAQLEAFMRTTIVLDDDLLDKAQSFSGIQEKSSLVRLALTRYVETEASRRLARLGGTNPDLVAPPRRRFEAE